MICHRLRHFGSIGVVTALLVACGGAQKSGERKFDPKTTGTIAGKVQDKISGEPLSMATVVVADTDDRRYEIPHASTDADGKYRIEGIPPGTYRVVAFYSDEATQHTNVAVKAGRNTSLDFKVQIVAEDGDTTTPHEDTAGVHAGTRDRGYGHSKHRTTGSIMGRILDAETQKPIPGAVVSATMPGLTNAIHAMADKHGRYRFVGIRPGIYTLSVYYHLVDRGNIEFRRAGVRVIPGRVARIQLRLDTKTEE